MNNRYGRKDIIVARLLYFEKKKFFYISKSQNRDII